MQTRDGRVVSHLLPFSHFLLLVLPALLLFLGTVCRYICVTTGELSVSQRLLYSRVINEKNHFMCLTYEMFVPVSSVRHCQVF